jgi:hypothetical protein
LIKEKAEPEKSRNPWAAQCHELFISRYTRRK